MGERCRPPGVQEAGVPILPGGQARIQKKKRLSWRAEIGFPVIVKAAGGGGRGMRIVRSEAELGSAQTASTEAAAALRTAMSILNAHRASRREIQVMADEHGDCVYLERVLDSTPASEASGRIAFSVTLRQQMGEAAVAACKAIGYSSAGTFEFLLDEDGQFYFMEMNTRIQVEHPVTEMVTLTDIVRNQIRVAEGDPLGFTQDEVIMVGHAIECRINAESPDTFTPSPGTITTFNLPGGPGVRVDTYVYPDIACRLSTTQ
jgi:acetyl-CoA carboxylase biotin carboxylase subunit